MGVFISFILKVVFIWVVQASETLVSLSGAMRKVMGSGSETLVSLSESMRKVMGSGIRSHFGSSGWHDVEMEASPRQITIDGGGWVRAWTAGGRRLQPAPMFAADASLYRCLACDRGFEPACALASHMMWMHSAGSQECEPGGAIHELLQQERGVGFEYDEMLADDELCEQEERTMVLRRALASSQWFGCMKNECLAAPIN